MAPWGRDLAKPMLAEAVRRAGVTWEAVSVDLQAGLGRLWLAVDDGQPIAAMVTKLGDDGVYECWLAGGAGARRWVPTAVERICAWAWEIGAEKCRVWGRRGWMRLLPDWEFVGVEDGLVILELGRG